MINNNNKVRVIVPAAGLGRRMGGDVPKQYLPFMGETVIEKTLGRLKQVDSLVDITVAISSDDHFFDRLSIADSPNIVTTIGGRERSDSVWAALMSLEDKVMPSDWILVHDAARCCVRTDVINRMLKQLSDSDVGGILGVPVSDTLKQVSSNQKIESTLDRSHIWQAQTPQLFRYGLLREALEHARKREQPITDEASAVELMGHCVEMCMGHYDNIKITHPDDLVIAEAFLKQQGQNPERDDVK